MLSRNLVVSLTFLSYGKNHVTARPICGVAKVTNAHLTTRDYRSPLSPPHSLFSIQPCLVVFKVISIGRINIKEKALDEVLFEIKVLEDENARNEQRVNMLTLLKYCIIIIVAIQVCDSDITHTYETSEFDAIIIKMI